VEVAVLSPRTHSKEKGMSTLVVIGYNDWYQAKAVHRCKALLHVGPMEVIGC